MALLDDLKQKRQELGITKPDSSITIDEFRQSTERLTRVFLGESSLPSDSSPAQGPKSPGSVAFNNRMKLKMDLDKLNKVTYPQDTQSSAAKQLHDMFRIPPDEELL